ncbi:hypothetical protein, partial [Streptomyces triticirhizae]
PAPRPADADPARLPAPAEPAAPIHQPGGFPTGDSAPNRSRCWDMLGPRTRERLAEKAGTVLAWWARLDPGEERPTAIAFGPLGLCRATPTTRHGRPVYLVERLRLDAGALVNETFTVDGSARRSRGVARFRRHAPDAPPPPVRPPTTLDLHPQQLGVLGNYPAGVQEFLQRPFLRDDRNVAADYYYEESRDFTGQRLYTVFCLSADRTVTLAAGTRTLPRGRPEERAKWEIECYRVPVLRG